MRSAKEVSKRTGSLDFLRIVATILIVFHHFQQVTGASFGRINFWGGKFNFSLVVEFFFVLSGFFMFRYVSKIKHGLGFRDFFLKRACRLLPLVLISAIVYEILICVYYKIFHESYFGIQVNIWGAIIDSLGIQVGWSFANPCVNNPTWYVSVLLLCYLVFYSITYVCRRLKVPPAAAYIFMVLVGCGIVTYGIDLPFLNYSAARGYYSFFFGILLGYFLNERKISLGLCLTSALVFGVLIYLIVSPFSWMAGNASFLFTFVCVPALIIIFSYKPVARLFKSSLFGIVGKITYDVYIWHCCGLIIMIILSKKMALDMSAQTVITMISFTIIQFAFGTISHYLIEKPVNKLVELKIRSVICSHEH